LSSSCAKPESMSLSPRRGMATAARLLSLTRRETIWGNLRPHRPHLRMR
jgi:hypothetical protein